MISRKILFGGKNSVFQNLVQFQGPNVNNPLMLIGSKSI